jgi:transcriptional regulator with XRE-family HTH domain
MTDFGTKLRALRLARGLTQAAVARLCDVTVITISNWEVGRSAPWPKNQAATLAIMEGARIARNASDAASRPRARLIDNVGEP